MQDINNSKVLSDFEGEIDIREIFSVLWAGKLKILVITLMFAISSVFYALSVPNQYKASALLAPAQQESSGLSGALGQMGGLASLAGVNIDNSGSGETEMAKAIMVSWNFIEGFIKNNNLSAELVAIKGWDQQSNKLLISEEIYDFKNERWLVNEPTSWSLFKSFSGRLSISEPGNSGFLSVSIEHYSPHVAKRWLDLYITAINKHMQEMQVKKVNNNINKLQEQIERTSNPKMQEVFYNIIEEQTKNKMLAEASPDYAFVAVSASMLPEERSQPNRALICISLTLLGGILSVFLVLLMHYMRKS
ncbi:MAG: Wzz/FepE/Etk N-terminal domain-containing protein [Gammaproteobacteria bacterium]